MIDAPTTRRPVRRVVVLSGVLTAVAALLALVVAPGTAGAAALPRAQVQAQQWWIGRLGLQDAWKVTRGAGTTVAVVDSGVDPGGDLRGAVDPGFGVGAIGGDGRRDTDPAIHGTRMAAEIAGRGTGFGLLGVAPAARILPVAVPEGASAATSDIVTALDRLSAMADPPDVVNMSIGTDTPTCPDDVQAAVRRAAAKGMILVSSAGNSPGEVEYPANCAGVVAVGAVDVDGRPWEKTARQPYVVLAGPGVKIIGPDTAAASGYGYGYGTSDAAAVVSGGFALLRAHFPRASARELVTRMIATARQFDGAQGTRSDAVGYGVARPLVAMTATVPASAPNPVYEALDRLGTAPTSAPPTDAPSGSATGSPVLPSGSASSPVTATPASGDGGSSAGVVAAVAAGVVVLTLVVLGLVLRSRRRAATPAGTAPTGPPTWGPPGP